MALAVVKRNKGDENRIRKSSLRFSTAARMCVLVGFNEGSPNNSRMLPSPPSKNPSSHSQKSGFADCRTLYRLQREVSYLQQQMEWYVFTYMDHLEPFLFLGGRPTAQLFVSYEKSNLSNKHIVQYIKKRWLEKCYFMLCI